MREHHNKEAGRMGTYEYVVAQIDGDYAQLQRVELVVKKGVKIDEVS